MCTFRETSRERAEWVSAPIEMKSTLVERVALDLDRKPRSGRLCDRLGDPAGQPEVVVFDQDPVVEAEAVVSAAGPTRLSALRLVDAFFGGFEPGAPWLDCA